MKKLREDLIFISLICLIALTLVALVLNNADRIDNWFAPKDTTYTILKETNQPLK